MIKVLGIESSCDETAVAIVTDVGRILSQNVRSQMEQHQSFGGVVPEIAARAHLQILPHLIDMALRDAQMTLTDLDAVAVTSGPGLMGGLLVGINMGHALAYAHDLPVYGINHLEGHALTARLTDKVAFPYLLLLVSGGHSQFLAIEDVGTYHRLGTTLDDAVGEAFDKVAKLLGLGYPGGPALEQCAKDGNLRRFDLPTPLRGKPGCDLSLSGLKTAVRHLVSSLPQPLSMQDRADVAASFQYAVGEMLADRLRNAQQMFAEMFSAAAPNVAIAGGVAANQYLRMRLQQAGQKKTALIYPPLALCGDNAVMIAWAALERMAKGYAPDPAIVARPRWPLDQNQAAKNNRAKA